MANYLLCYEVCRVLPNGRHEIVKAFWDVQKAWAECEGLQAQFQENEYKVGVANGVEIFFPSPGASPERYARRDVIGECPADY